MHPATIEGVAAPRRPLPGFGLGADTALRCLAVETLPTDLNMRPLGASERLASEQVKLFQLLAVVLDPYTHQSAWLLETGARILRNFAGADCRAAFVLTCDDDGARQFLGPLADELMCFVDPDRTFVSALGATELPALAHIDHDANVVGLSSGWQPDEWREIAEALADVMSWSRPAIPKAGDPLPFDGTPVSA